MTRQEKAEAKRARGPGFSVVQAPRKVRSRRTAPLARDLPKTPARSLLLMMALAAGAHPTFVEIDRRRP